MSHGIMFPVETNLATGKPLGKSYMQARARREPQYAVTQFKRDDEMHPSLSPEHWFAY